MPRLKPQELLEKLREALTYGDEEFIALYIFKRYRDPFKVLVGVILSQNTAEPNTFKAYRRLEKEVGVSVDAIASAPLEKIEDAIRPAGLWRQKARSIKSLAEYVRAGNDLEAVLAMPPEKARRALTSIPGVGEKTVDVFLALFRGGVVPVDTHIRRVANRLGLSKSSSYRKIREDLERYFPSDLRLEAHMYLILLGRRICRARKPLCEVCPLRSYCEYVLKGREIQR